MKRKQSYGVIATLWVGFFFLATVVSPQESTIRPHIGVPQDWSQHHIVFSRDALLQHPNLLSQEPRVLHQAMQRWQGRNSSVVHAIDTATPTSAVASQRDWSVVLRGRLAANMFPAKFSFNPAAPPDCANDYVVFGLTAPGKTGGTANLVAFNNLYGPGGLCTTGVTPSVMFAYNISTVGGGIVTSPVLSREGTKIAFIESVLNPASATFHVLTWTAGEGAIASAAAPTAMTSLPLSSSADCSTSSPWVDYDADTAYVGTDDGKLHKITGVFNGTPTLAGGNWPITVSNKFRLTPPVVDVGRHLLLVGSANGILYQIDTTAGTITNSLVIGVSGSGRKNVGIWAAPILDVTSGTAFVVSSNDGASVGASAVLVEVDTALFTQLAKAHIGQGSTTGIAVNLFEPALDNRYFNNPDNGLIRLCGTGDNDITPYQYAFGFIAGTTPPTLRTTPSFKQQLLTSTNARCTAWTEFFNPNIGSGGTDFFFFGLTQDCTAPGLGFPDGCVVARSSNTVLTKATLTGGSSGVVVDNYSTLGQASSIYLMATRASIASKLTQNGLN